MRRIDRLLESAPLLPPSVLRETQMRRLHEDSSLGDKGTEALRNWYNDGADGAINWGQPGDFDDCVSVASKYIDSAEGFCNERHQDATGAPPGHAPGEQEDKAVDK